MSISKPTLVVLGSLLVFVGCTPIGQPTPSMDGAPLVASALAPGDQISVSFPSVAQLSQSRKIPLDGKISLPIVGEVKAAGKSPGALQSELRGRYESYLQNPDVVVALESSAAVVYVNGEVRTPGKVPLDRKLTVYEAVMESGGFSELANPRKVTVTRLQDGELTSRTLDLKKGQGGAFYVRPFDTITVEESRF